MATITLRRCENCGLTIPSGETGESWVYLGVQSILYREYQPYSGYLNATSGEFCGMDCAHTWLDGQARTELAVFVAAARKIAKKGTR